MRSSSIIGFIVPALLVPLLLVAAGKGFRTQHLLEEHFGKYGRDFGTITQDRYLHLAQQLRDAKPGRNTLEARRQGGGGSKFDRRHGWYVAYDEDGTIRTFFVPREGLRYFERQARSYSPPE